MQYKLVENTKHRSMFFILPFGENFDNLIELQKSFARLCMHISLVTPIFVFMSKELMPICYNLLPKHITYKQYEGKFVFFSDISMVLISNRIDQKQDYKILNFDKNESAISLYQCFVDNLESNYRINSSNIININNIKFSQNEFSVNDEGVMFITQSLLSKNSLNKENLMKVLKDYGVKDIIVLPQKSNVPFVRFINNNTLLIHREINKESPFFNENINTLDSLKGILKLYDWKVIYLDAPNFDYGDNLIKKDQTNAELKLISYLDFIPTNERVIVPLLDPSKDNQVLNNFKNIFKDKDVCGVESLEFAKSNCSIRDFIYPIVRS